jgi:hypothetical protein
MIRKIISGGQAGAERAALDVAMALGISHGGWIPKGRLTETGPLPDKYHLKQMPSPGYPECAEQNIIRSDATLIVYRGKLSGTSTQAIAYAVRHQKECLHIDLNTHRGFPAAQMIQSWIVENDIETLNIAGPRASEDSDIYADTARLLRAVCQLFFIDSKTSEPGRLKPLYPRTVEEAVDRLFYELPFKDKSNIAKLEKHELKFLHPELGTYIADNYGLRFTKGELMKDCRFAANGSDLNENAAAALIIRKLWQKLRKTHALRVVK